VNANWLINNDAGECVQFFSEKSLSLQIALMDFKFNINHGAPGCEQHTRRPTHFDSVPADGEIISFSAR